MHVELMALHKRHDDRKGPQRVSQQRSEVLEQGAATNRGPAVQAWKQVYGVKKRTGLRDPQQVEETGLSHEERKNIDGKG